MEVLDALVVTLGLDSRDYQRGVKSYRDDRKRLAEEETKYNRSAEDAQRRMTQGIRTLRNETAGFLFMLAGANSVKEFASNLLSGDAATGRLARNLGLATEQVSAWEGAIKRVGGSASDIQGALRSVASAFQSLQLTGTTGHDADFQGLGVTARDLENPEEALLKISEASSRMSRPEFNARLSRIGFDQNTINLLAKGRGEVTRMLEEQRKLGVATDESAEAAQKFQDEISQLQTALVGQLRPAVFQVVEQLNRFLSSTDAANFVVPILAGGVGALALSFAAAYGPALLLAGAIGAVVAAAMHWDEIKDTFTPKTGPGPSGMQSYGVDNNGRPRSAWDQFTGLFTVHDGAPPPGFDNASNPLRGGAGGGVRGTLSRLSQSGRGGQSNRTAEYVERYFRSRGYTAAQARGITAAVVAEGGLSARTGGGHKGRALGIGQLLGSRRAEFLRRYGPNFTIDDELAFMDWELRGGDPGGAAVRGSRTEQETLRNAITKFYRPAPGFETERDLQAGSRWLGGRPGMNVAGRGGGPTTNNQTTSVGQVIVYTAATDADGIAHDMRGALAKRGLVVQANTGLQP